MDLTGLMTEEPGSPTKAEHPTKRQKTSEAGSDYEGGRSEASDAAMSDAEEPTSAKTDLRGELANRDSNVHPSDPKAQDEQAKRDAKNAARRAAAKALRKEQDRIIKASMLNRSPANPHPNSYPSQNANVLAALDALDAAIFNPASRPKLDLQASPQRGPSLTRPRSPVFRMGSHPSAPPSPVRSRLTGRPVDHALSFGVPTPVPSYSRTLGQSAGPRVVSQSPPVAPSPQPESLSEKRAILASRIRAKVQRTGDPYILRKFSEAELIPGQKGLDARECLEPVSYTPTSPSQ
jgi:hypothetical protein